MVGPTMVQETLLTVSVHYSHLPTMYSSLFQCFFCYLGYTWWNKFTVEGSSYYYNIRSPFTPPQPSFIFWNKVMSCNKVQNSSFLFCCLTHPSFNGLYMLSSIIHFLRGHRLLVGLSKRAKKSAWSTKLRAIPSTKLMWSTAINSPVCGVQLY